MPLFVVFSLQAKCCMFTDLFHFICLILISWLVFLDEKKNELFHQLKDGGISELGSYYD